VVIICGDDENLMSVKNDIKGRVVTFGLNNKTLDYHAEDIVFDQTGSSSYTLCAKDKKLIKIDLNVLGLHNIYNSLAASAACIEAGCSTTAIREGLGKFLSTHRRFEHKGSYKGAKVVDDYAHHPSEIKATLNAVKNIDARRIWCVFQPHTYTRTKTFLEDFAGALAIADKVILADIYAAREDNVSGITSMDLVDRINSLNGNAVFIPDFHLICGYLKEHVRKNDLILTMGAGDIYKVADELVAAK
jgi:UDP-N-acetylmuramate--alanine ligase